MAFGAFWFEGVGGLGEPLVLVRSGSELASVALLRACDGSGGGS